MSVSTRPITSTTFPGYNSEGYLPVGIYKMGWDEFVTKFSFTSIRELQIKGLIKAIPKFKAAGASHLYIDGSFITKKYNPSDYDVLYDITEIDLEILDPILKDASSAGRKTQKVHYRGEFVPLTNQANDYMTYWQFYQVSKSSGNAKGIIVIDI